MNQTELELKYSKKYIQSAILDYVDMEDPKFKAMNWEIRLYLSEKYSYDSKNRRVAHVRGLEIPIDQLVLEIITATILAKEIVPVQGICTRLANIFNFEDTLDGIKTAAELLAVTEKCGYFELWSFDHALNKTGTLGISSSIAIPAELQEELDLIQYLPPMVEPPNDWVSNREGGFHSFSESCILGSMNHHKDTQALDALNILQGNEYQLNQYVLEELEELPSEDITTPAQISQWKMQLDQSGKLYQDYKDIPFYFTWKYDKRGRMYSQGYHVNIQGSEYKRALIDLSQKEYVTS